MKLSKALLSAIVTGITMQGAVSCKKEVIDNKSKVQQANPAKTEKETKTVPDLCLACGMG